MRRKLKATTVAGRIRERREQLGLTQTEASARVGWKGHSVWADVEACRRELIYSTMEKIAAALECAVKDLIP